MIAKTAYSRTRIRRAFRGSDGGNTELVHFKCYLTLKETQFQYKSHAGRPPLNSCITRLTLFIMLESIILPTLDIRMSYHKS